MRAISTETWSLAENTGDSPLPLGDDTAESRAAGRERQKSSGMVLLVEDNASDVQIIRRVLEQCGRPVDVRVVRDGEQALDMLKHWEDTSSRPRPFLILLDWNLPRVSGADVLAYARHSQYWKAVPIVVVTSTDSRAEIGQITAAGATAHFRKPTDLDAYLDLNQIVLEALSKSDSVSQ